jgi:hypothetical protein
VRPSENALCVFAPVLRRSHLKKLLFGLAVAAIVLIGAGLTLSLWALRYRAPCDLPCQDLGREPLPGRDPNEIRLSKPHCAPLKIALELARPTATLGRRYTLWFKVRLTNASCYKLSMIDASPLIWWFDDRTYRVPPYLTIHVDGPDGKEIRNLDHVREHGFTAAEIAKMSGLDKRYIPDERIVSEYGEVIPYEDDNGAFRRWQSDPSLAMNNNGYIQLLPGHSITTTASNLAPHTEKQVIQHTNGGVGLMNIHVPTALSGIEQTVDSFRVLDQYIFHKPGHYKIRVAYEPPPITAEPIYPYASRVPDSVQNLLVELGLTQWRDTDPAFRDGASYPIRLESAPVDFEVVP